ANLLADRTPSPNGNHSQPSFSSCLQDLLLCMSQSPGYNVPIFNQSPDARSQIRFGLTRTDNELAVVCDASSHRHATLLRFWQGTLQFGCSFVGQLLRATTIMHYELASAHGERVDLADGEILHRSRARHLVAGSRNKRFVATIMHHEVASAYG